MSDERFERQLRSVLAADSPERAPGSLHATVADLGRSGRVEGRVRFGRRAGAISGLGVAAVAVAVAILAFAGRAGPVEFGAGGDGGNGED